MHQKLTKSVDV